MQGNVTEWCYDDLNNYPVDSEEAIEDADFCVLRDGSFRGQPREIRSADRNFYQPGLRRYVLGFRAARTYP